LWSQAYTGFYGNIAARCGAEGGNGGQVETSSHNNLQAMGNVDASASAGQAGNWLLDPLNVTITTTTTGGSFNSGSPNVFTPTANSATVLNTTIESSLNAGTSVTLTTGSTGAQAGNITLASNIIKTTGGAATLTLNADGNIIVNAGARIDDTASAGALSVGFYSKGAIYFTANGAATNVIDIKGALNLGGFGQTYAIGNATYVNGIYVGSNNTLKANTMSAFGQGYGGTNSGVTGSTGGSGATGATGAGGSAGSTGSQGSTGSAGTILAPGGTGGIGGTGGSATAASQGGVGGSGFAGGTGGTGGSGYAGIMLASLATVLTQAGQTLDGQGGTGGTGGTGGGGLTVGPNPGGPGGMPVLPFGPPMTVPPVIAPPPVTTP
jgi:hypothetical protein